MTARDDRWVTPLDRRLLRRLAAEPSAARAARALGVGRDRVVYRLARLRRLYGAPVVEAARGGPGTGGSRLTRLGRSLLRASSGLRPPGNRWSGVYRGRPSPRVALSPSAELAVAFRAPDGARVDVGIDPEAFVVGRHKVALSARNVLEGTVATVRRKGDGTATLRVLWARRPVRVALTGGSVERLRLAPGVRVYLYLKAVAVRRLG
jgi:molybdopterin-binding protein/molybdate transport repressor ModE-like protein